MSEYELRSCPSETKPFTARKTSNMLPAKVELCKVNIPNLQSATTAFDEARRVLNCCPEVISIVLVALDISAVDLLGSRECFHYIW
jgi:hypothetical protein